MVFMIETYRQTSTNETCTMVCLVYNVAMSYLQCGPAEFIDSVGMHPAFLQDPLHLAAVPFGRCPRQGFAGIHLTQNHYLSCLGGDEKKQ